jgi:hypothetical protein
LRDLGARVTKVLAPEGKQIEPPFFAYGAGRGMTSVRLDLKSEDGLAKFLELCGEADVVVESYRPGVAARLGIGYEAVQDVNPMIVYASRGRRAGHPRRDDRRRSRRRTARRAVDLRCAVPPRADRAGRVPRRVDDRGRAASDGAVRRRVPGDRP